jgi:hypothetical protein
VWLNLFLSESAGSRPLHAMVGLVVSHFVVLEPRNGEANATALEVFGRLARLFRIA